MFAKVIFALFVFFTHKQIYAGRHFAGGSKTIGFLLGIIGLINLLSEIVYLIYISATSSFINAFLTLAWTLVVFSILNTCTSKIAMKQAKKYINMQEQQLFYNFYNYRCDVMSTICALIGIVFNAVALIMCIIITL